MYEVRQAVAVGIARHLSAMEKGLKNAYGYRGYGRSPWEIAVEGACAEMAVAKYLGLYWPGSVDTFKSVADIPPDIEVRSGRTGGTKLIVRPDDPDDRYYVLCVGDCPNYTVLGYLSGREAKLEKYFGSPNKRPPAYFVPAEDLRPTIHLSNIIGI